MKTRFRFVVVYFFVAYLNRRCSVRPQAIGSLALNRRCGVRPQASGRLASDGSSCVCNRHLVEPLEPSGRLAQARRSYLPTGHRYLWFMCGDRRHTKISVASSTIAVWWSAVYFSTELKSIRHHRTAKSSEQRRACTVYRGRAVVSSRWSDPAYSHRFPAAAGKLAREQESVEP